MLMACHANKARQCWLSTETMGRLLGLDRSGVSRALAQLLERGHVTRQQRSLPGRGLTSSVYTLVNRPAPLPEIPAAENAVDGDDGPDDTADEQLPGGAEPAPAATADPVVQSLHQRPLPGGADCAHTGGAEPALSLGAGSAPESVSVISNDDQYDDDDDRARTREASSSSALDDFLPRGQAILIFDEMAGRIGWPLALKLTKREGRRLDDLLAEWSLDDWREGMAKAERSTYLAKTKPGIRFFLNPDNFTQLMRGVYDPEFDPAGRFATTMGIMAAFDREDRPQETPVESPPPPYPPPPEAPSVPRYLQDLRTVGKYSAKSAAEMDAKAEGWLQQLEAAGIDPSTAREILADEAHRAPRSWSGLEHLEERVGRHVQERADGP